MTAAQQIERAKDALARWPFIPAVEDEHQLPRWMLLAVGLRETGLDPAYGSGAKVDKGDGGFAHGPWQFDIHPQNSTPARRAIAARIDTGDVQFAAEIAAGTLRANFVAHGNDWTKALNVYNSGQTKTEHTTGRNYGPNVLEALDLLQRSLGPLDHPAPLPVPGPVAPQPRPGPAPTSEDDLQPIATDPTNGDYWVLTGPQGGVDSYGVGGQKNDRYYGNLIDHPELDAGEGKGNGPAIAIAYWPGAGNGAGYVIFTRDGTGYVHAYHFDLTTLKV